MTTVLPWSGSGTVVNHGTAVAVGTTITVQCFRLGTETVCDRISALGSAQIPDVIKSRRSCFRQRKRASKVEHIFGNLSSRYFPKTPCSAIGNPPAVETSRAEKRYSYIAPLCERKALFWYILSSCLNSNSKRILTENKSRTSQQ